MQTRVMYIELKSGYGDKGPAWIGRVKFSKSGRTLYFNDKAFKKVHGFSFNHYDIETGEEYWISGVKKNGQDRHWAGSGKVMIDEKIINEYLKITGQKTLDDRKFIIVDIPDVYPIDRIMELENE
ncbi:MAG: mannose-1-phosphate guanylyltransferase [Candidatus Saccharibacteria bacterium]